MQWFISGELVQSPSASPARASSSSARPLTRWGEDRLGLQPADRRQFGREDLLFLREVVAEAADAIAARRRRSLRWCRSCRRVHAPEWFVGTERIRRQCEAVFAHLDA